MKEIAVLMTCYNRVETTLECLRRLFLQEIPKGYSFDVWLVDDGSPDKTGERVKNAYPQVNIIQGTGNLYWCKGMRLAWDSAMAANDYEFYMWLNDDVRLLEGVISTLIKDSEKIESEGSSIFVLSGTMAAGYNGNELTYGCYSHSQVYNPVGVPISLGDEYSMSGNLVLIPKSVMRLLGPICGLYSHAYGDSDYRRRMIRYEVPLFCCSIICGICPMEPNRYIRLKGLGLLGRIKALFSPKGFSLRDLIIYRVRNWGAGRALLSTFHVIYKVLFTEWK